MKKVLLLTRSLSGGGAEKVMANISLHLPKSFTKTIVLYDAERIDYKYNGDIINLASKPFKNLVSKVIAFIYRVYKIKKIKKSKGIETSISFLDSPNIVNIFSKQTDKIIISERNYKPNSNKDIYSYLTALFMKTIYNKADLIITVSEFIKKDIVERFNIKEDMVKVIYNPYDVKLINQLSCEQIEDEYKHIFQNHTLVNVGSLTSQKGQSYLIDIFLKIKEKITYIKLLILGEGVLEIELKNKVRDLNLENDVFFIGFQKNPYKFIKKADLFVFPSLYEGFPNALVEAMACGIPVISSDCKSGPREILAPNTSIKDTCKEVDFAEYGILMPEMDASNADRITDVWAETIVNLLGNKDILEQYSSQGQKRVKAFSAEKVLSQWIDVI